MTKDYLKIINKLPKYILYPIAALLTLQIYSIHTDLGNIRIHYTCRKKLMFYYFWRDNKTTAFGRHCKDSWKVNTFPLLPPTLPQGCGAEVTNDWCITFRRLLSWIYLFTSFLLAKIWLSGLLTW